jgi:hypothetical protein
MRERERTYEMILAEAVRQRLFFFFFFLFQNETTSKNVKEKENQTKEFLRLQYTYIHTMTSQV